MLTKTGAVMWTGATADFEEAGADRFQVLIVSDETQESGAVLTEAVRSAGGRLLDRVAWQDAVAHLDAMAAQPVLMLDARGVEEEQLASTLYRIDGVASGRDLSIVCGMARDQIDLAAAGLIGRDVHLLCDPGEGDWAAGLAVSNWAHRLQLADRGSSGAEAARLARLNEEVARIADVLSRLARREPQSADPPIVAETRPAYIGKPVDPVEIDPVEMRQVIRARRLRDRQFGEGLFEDPAWDMILDLYAAYLERAQVSVSSLCIAAAVAPTTALRWIGKLTDIGLFERQPDPFDRRRAYMALSQQGREGMNAYVSAARSLGLPIV